jgi:hypothetical protein
MHGSTNICLSTLRALPGLIRSTRLDGKRPTRHVRGILREKKKIKVAFRDGARDT